MKSGVNKTMPEDRDLSVRDAGRRIEAAGLADDVIQATERQITQRRGRQREAAADDADHTPEPKKKPKAKREPEPEAEDDEGEDLDQDYGEDDADEDEDADDGSNREDDGDEDGDDDGDEADEDSEAATSKDAELHTVKVNGKEIQVPLAELKAGYQRTRDYHEKTQALANRGRDLTAGHSKVAEAYTRKLQQAGAIVGKVRQLLLGDINSQELAQLRHTDPQAWSVQRQVMQDRIQGIDNVLQSINTDYERHVNETRQTNEASVSATLQQEHALLVKSIPDWDGPGKERLASYLVNRGFTAQELGNVTDARMLVVAENSRKWEEYMRNKSQPLKKQVKPAPKAPARPGQGQLRKAGETQSKSRRHFEQAKTTAKKTGDMRDAGKAISRLL